MTTLNDNLNALFSELHTTVEKAEQKRDTAVAKAKADFSTTEDKAKAKFEKELKNLAHDAFENGVTLEEFAKAYGKSIPTTRKHLTDAGVVVPQSKRGVKSQYSESEQEAIAQEWYKADTSARLRLAADKNVTDATMRNWAIEHGIYVPKKRETTEVEVEAQELVNA